MCVHGYVEHFYVTVYRCRCCCQGKTQKSLVGILVRYAAVLAAD